MVLETLDVEKANQVTWNIARHVMENYPESTLDDLSQEVWLWIVEHQAEVLSWDEDEWVARLYHRGYRVAYAMARKERAAVLGYEPWDEFFYSFKMIRRLLPLYFEERGPEDDEFLIPDRDAAMDFERAFAALDGETSSLLTYIFQGDDAEGRTKALAASYEISEDAARQRVQRALKRLREALGGANPNYEGPANRTVLSNAQAAAITRREYGTS